MIPNTTLSAPMGLTVLKDLQNQLNVHQVLLEQESHRTMMFIQHALHVKEGNIRLKKTLASVLIVNRGMYAQEAQTQQDLNQSN